jgi:hypothetical protein
LRHRMRAGFFAGCPGGHRAVLFAVMHDPPGAQHPRQYPVSTPPETRQPKCGDAPVPDSVTFCGLPAALSLTLSAAVRVPVIVGWKVILIVQLAPATSELPQVCVCPKSPALVPVIAMPVMLKVVVPTFVSVTVMAALVVPTVTDPKFKLVGKSFAVVPIPLRLTFCGLPAALSLTLSAALRVPVVVGLNVILIEQLAPAASELPQVWV